MLFGFIVIEFFWLLFDNFVFMMWWMVMMLLCWLGIVEDVVGVVLFLLLFVVGFVIGYDLVVDGGMLVMDGS